jgi:hypothetical protein
MRTNCMTALFGAAAALVTMNARAALVSTDGGLGVYDTTNNVTWTSNADLMATQAASYGGGSAAFVAAVIADSGGVIYDTPNGYDTVPFSGVYTLSASDFNTTPGSTDGAMDWWAAQAWVHYLNVTDYGGSSRWTLPSTVDNETSSRGFPNGLSGTLDGYNFIPQSTSQLAQLFYGSLGQVAGSSITTTHSANYSLFSNVENTYWSGTEDSAEPLYAWYFDPENGIQAYGKLLDKDYVFALPVSTGEVSAVPEPGAAWLLLSGLVGFAFARQRGRQANRVLA